MVYVSKNRKTYETKTDRTERSKRQIYSCRCHSFKTSFPVIGRSIIWKLRKHIERLNKIIQQFVLIDTFQVHVQQSSCETTFWARKQIKSNFK